MSNREKLDDLRGEIDSIDRQIVSSLDQRMALAQRIWDVKRGLGIEIYDPQREAEIVQGLIESGPRSLTPQDIEEVYAAIFLISRWWHGEGKMRGNLCISVVESDPEKVRQRMKTAAGEGDLVELRLDALHEIRLDGLLPFIERPLIVTNRRREEGGLFQGGEEERLAYLEEAMGYGATYIDVEWMSPEPLRSRLLKGRGDVEIILSYHDLQKTPPLDGLISILEEMVQVDAGIYKIVTWAHTLDDSLTVLRFLQEVRARGRKVISHCMGEEGRISRVLAPLFGSCMAYTALSERQKAAPGQMTAGQMRRVWEVLGG